VSVDRAARIRRALQRPSALLLAALAALAIAGRASGALEPGCPDTHGREDAMIGGEVLVLLTEFPGSEAKQGCVVGFIPAAPDEVLTVLRDAARYDEYMPLVVRSDVSPGSGGAIVNSQELNLPFPIGDRHFTIQIWQEYTGDATMRLSFSYVPGSGNVKDTRGHWLIEPWRSGSRVTYVLWTDPGGAIPKWAVNRASRRTLPEVVSALRERVHALDPGGSGDHPSS
jgi:hypothetical protein